jgi:hypothetical protein
MPTSKLQRLVLRNDLAELDRASTAQKEVVAFIVAARHRCCVLRGGAIVMQELETVKKTVKLRSCGSADTPAPHRNRAG